MAIRFRTGLKVQGYPSNFLPWSTRFTVPWCYFSFTLSLLIMLTQGWTVFVKVGSRHRPSFGMLTSRREAGTSKSFSARTSASRSSLCCSPAGRSSTRPRWSSSRTWTLTLGWKSLTSLMSITARTHRHRAPGGAVCSTSCSRNLCWLRSESEDVVKLYGSRMQVILGNIGCLGRRGEASLETRRLCAATTPHQK